jgi:Zn-dependent protease
MGNWWVQEAWSVSPVLLVSWVVWVIGSIVLHELAHGWAALACGDRTPIETGHMTLNPVVHMGPNSLIAFAILGIAWGMMPVNPDRFRRRYDDVIVSFAGPLMNLLLAALCLAALVLWVAIGQGQLGSWRPTEPLYPNVRLFLFCGLGLNITLALFNLLPVPPLDGSRILGALVPPIARLWQSPNAGIAVILLFLAVFLFAGDAVFRFGFGAASDLIDWALLTFLGLRPIP